MLLLLSPAKKMDFNDEAIPTSETSIPTFLSEAEKLVKKLRKLSKEELKKLMSISDNLAELNWDRFQQWTADTTENTKQAAYAFKGDVYMGLEASSLSKEDINYAQNHLRILSGLYGLLKPLDLIHPYRLEMGTSLQMNDKVSNLYQFWQKKLTKQINEELSNHSSKALINLASNEYSKVADFQNIKFKYLNIKFKYFREGKYKSIGLLAKKARGQIAAYILKNRIEDMQKIKLFDVDGYAFDDKLSSEKEWVFVK